MIVLNQTIKYINLVDKKNDENNLTYIQWKMIIFSGKNI